MHTCPDCGQACYCNGDVDDSPVDENAEMACIHCLHADDGDDPDDWDEDEDCYGPLDDCDCPRCRARFDLGNLGAHHVRCRVCGCDDVHACMVGGSPCYWVEEDLCSACAGLRRKGDVRRRRRAEARARKTRVRLLHRLGYRSPRRY